jgi:NAD(P)-dependent dehydrogenase (short-subunit alcohol dehydrogenase family)
MHPMSGRFDGRVAVVTGAASGIGRAIAKRFVADGGRVVAGDVNADGLASLEHELGAHIVSARCDVTIEADVAELVAIAENKFHPLDAMFNVAGASRGALIVDMTEEDWDFTVDLCLKGVFFGIKHAARQMIAAGRTGAIINIASLNSRVPMFFGSAYSAAKAGVASLSESAALELGEHGIRVSTISPGLTDTPLVSALSGNANVLASFMKQIPLKRMASPEDIANAATFLASNEASYISGVNLFVDGGWEHTAYPDLRVHLAELVAQAKPEANPEGIR